MFSAYSFLHLNSKLQRVPSIVQQKIELFNMEFSSFYISFILDFSLMQVLELVANYYAETPQEKRNLIKFFSKYPGIGFLNVAVS
jgi:hypothetical protein